MMYSLFWLIFACIQLSSQLEINITRIENCDDPLPTGEEWPIELHEVHYDYNDKGFIDQIHGKYTVRTVDTREKELTIMVYKCSTEDPQPCEHKQEQIIVDLHCEKFRNDGSGIWYMISQAMSGSTCGEETGLFDFDIPRIKHEYFEKYIAKGEQSTRYRMHLLFHKKSEETKDRRACVELHFDVYH